MVLDQGDTWRFNVNFLAKIDGCIIELLLRRSGPEIQVVALGLALEATKRVGGEVRRERTTAWRGRVVNRTGASELIAARFGRIKFQQFQDLLHRSLGSHRLEVDAGRQGVDIAGGQP